mgnify:CR=1 FL=1
MSSADPVDPAARDGAGAAPKTWIVGRGRVGRALHVALPGAQLLAGRADTAACATPANTAQTRDLVRVLAQRTALEPLIFAVPDAALRAAAERVALALRGTQSSAGAGVALHTSGALAADASGPLAPLVDLGFDVGALHPLRAVPAGGGPGVLRGALAAIAGGPAALATARALAQAVGLEVFEIAAAGEARVRYHAGACLAAGGAVALIDAALALFASAGIERDLGRRALCDLVVSAANNTRATPAASALTGPIARGDVDVVAAHLASLRGPDLARERDLYRTLSSRLLALVSHTLSPQDGARLAALLHDLPEH